MVSMEKIAWILVNFGSLPHVHLLSNTSCWLCDWSRSLSGKIFCHNSCTQTVSLPCGFSRAPSSDVWTWKLCHNDSIWTFSSLARLRGWTCVSGVCWKLEIVCCTNCRAKNNNFNIRKQNFPFNSSIYQFLQFSYFSRFRIICFVWLNEAGAQLCTTALMSDKRRWDVTLYRVSTKYLDNLGIAKLFGTIDTL